MPISCEGTPNYWLSCMIIDRMQSKVSRDELISICHEASIEVRPNLETAAYAKCISGKANVWWGVSESLFHDGLCLPSGSNLSDEDREKVISTFFSA